MGLTADAEKAIADAIAIVRSDKVHEYIRRSSKPADPPATPPATPPTPPAPTGGPAPPPPKPDDPPTPPADGGQRKSAYWGELLDD